MKEMGYNTISRVTESWEAARRRCSNFEDDVGTLILQKMFELQPKAKTVFGFEKDQEPIAGDTTTTAHAHTVVSMFDNVLQMLGPDTELIEDILKQVAGRHKSIGVKSSYFAYMGQAVTHALQETLKGDFTENHKEAWEEVYEELSAEIVRNMLN